ncbi:hypothetical protein MCANUF31_02735 [Mycoplasmopsis canis UF31]|nr:hypothetical protein MCANUF31_02735 [Mycoplasmopsis canis UF31]
MNPNINKKIKLNTQQITKERINKIQNFFFPDFQSSSSKLNPSTYLEFNEISFLFKLILTIKFNWNFAILIF